MKISPPLPVPGSIPSPTRGCLGALAAAALALLAAPASAWEPTAPVELVVPAGTGGGADQMARFVAQMVTKHKLMNQPLTVVNKAGNSGAEGLLDVKAAKGNPHKLIITLSNLFTTPLATGTDFSWRDITPVQMLALDQFVLWVNAESPHKSAKELLDALRASQPGSVKLGGTGSKQEDQLISVLLETAASTRLAYLPLKGGGDVAKSLAAKEVDITVNNPIEAAKLWNEGKVRPLCVFDGNKLDYQGKITATQSWGDLPTCMSFGIPVQYLMMRGIFMSPGVGPEHVAYYSGLLDKVRALPEWRDFMAQGAFKQSVMTGEPFANWLDRSENFHKVLMREAKLTYAASGAAAPVAGGGTPKATPAAIAPRTGAAPEKK
ncbi:MAG TPA: tripartite tricarboxylate transporter substrate-binding protein [Burkholderiaceae bacterium]|nr:tripartite tricarboxylate transporter substrate-binding protein [Burkholderiaceae bacterium]